MIPAFQRPTASFFPASWSIFVGIAVLTLLIRWPFHFLHILPNYLEFRPDVFLIPLAGLAGGIPGALGILISRLVGDGWFGEWSVLSIFQAVGEALFAFSTWRLWSRGRSESGARAFLQPGWRNMLRFIVAAFPGAWVAAAWTALGAEWERLYPFAYVFGIVLLQNLLFLFLLGPVFYEWTARLADARRLDALPAPPACPFRLAAAVWVGGVGAGCVGLWLSAQVYGLHVFQPVRLGLTSGAWMKTVTTLLCVGPWVALGWEKRRAAEPMRREEKRDERV